LVLFSTSTAIVSSPPTYLQRLPGRSGKYTFGRAALKKSVSKFAGSNGGS
jgi:hypothetical protein